MARPVFLLLSSDGHVLAGLATDLRRRFDVDYRVVAEPTAQAALAVLTLLADAGEPVALVIVDERLPDPGALDFLVAAHDLHPAAKRVLLVERGDWSSRHPAIQAMSLGRIDYHLYQPWRPVERILYAAVGEFLAAWERGGEPTDVVFRIVGPEHTSAAHDLRDLLTRGGVPYRFSGDTSAAGRELLREVGAAGDRLPVAVHYDGSVLVQPSYAQIVAKLGLPTRSPVAACDVVIVGAGPAGLAAAVYAASEGLETVVLEPLVPGGQAGTSSLIRNYLGFPRGLSGDELTNRALEQAWLFGAHLVVSPSVTRIEASGADWIVHTSGGDTITARAVVLATGVAWRRLGVPSLEALIGAGVFYGAAGAEARALTGNRAYVVGAGNSAGQAALHLARYAASVTLVVRGRDLTAGMSDYLITEIDKTATIEVRSRTEVVGGGGRNQLESLVLRHSDTGATVTEAAAALFVMIGAEPHTGWLPRNMRRDQAGYLLTGADLPAGSWLLQRPPLPLETSLAGVFAAGDVRAGSVKRVASAAGGGAIAIQSVHRYLAEPATPGHRPAS
jgi:thioredoxin reductase (NADPH)